MSLLMGGVIVFSGLGGTAMLVELPRVIAGAFALAMLAAWLVGLCGMVGYFRWYFSSGSGG